MTGKYKTNVDLVGKDDSLHKKWNFPLAISSVNVTKSAVSCGFGHIYWRNHCGYATQYQATGKIEGGEKAPSKGSW